MNLLPPLPYAPRRNRPLSLWNPLDYLVLLYWVFYFPQALRWYVETFGTSPAETNIWQAIREDAVQRRLAIQGLVLALAIPFSIFAFVLRCGVETSFDLKHGMAYVVVYVLMLISVFGMLGFKVKSSMVAIGAAISKGLFVQFVAAVMMVVGFTGPIDSVAVLVAIGVAASVLFGMLFQVILGPIGGVGICIVRQLADAVAAGVTMGVVVVAAGAIAGPKEVMVLGMPFGVVVGVTLGVIILRLDAALLSLLPALFQPSQWVAITLQRVSPLPIVHLRRRLAQRLLEDWLEGLRENEGLLRYSLQFIPVTYAIEQALIGISHDKLLPSIASWCSMPLYDWRVVCFQSASLRAGFLEEFWDGLFIGPRRWRPQIAVAPRHNTPARAACAGFWHLRQSSVEEAATAFAAVRGLPHGEELYANAQALAAATQCQSLEQLGNWQSPECLPGELLRPQVRAVFEELAEVAKEIALVQHSRSIRQRNSALNRASGTLNDLPKQLSDCPNPERALFEQIAQKWLEIVLASASAVGALEVREQVASPYIVGAPVPAHRLAGRQDSFDQIAAAWNKPGQRDSLVIFGHRRMGKSSIVRNLLHFCPFGGDTGLAVLNLQTVVDWSQDLSDLCHAIAFQLWQAVPVPLDEPLPEDFEQRPLAALRRLLASLDRLEGRGRYILILDEYELLDEKLPEVAANDFITLLRGLTQQYPWLVIALVGLHNLRERSASFYQAIYAWRPIKVGLLDEGSFADMLQVEDDNFPLEYNPAALARAYALTGGQPFLGQLLGDSLVQRFNRQLRVQLDPPLSTFSAEDVDAVVEDPHFYQQGDMYFDGIWAQASEIPGGQQTLLRALAAHDSGLAQEALRQASGLDPHAFSAALDALEQHDVVKCSGDSICQYTVELMRCWVASKHRTRMDRGVIGAN